MNSILVTSPLFYPTFPKLSDRFLSLNVVPEARVMVEFGIWEGRKEISKVSLFSSSCVQGRDYERMFFCSVLFGENVAHSGVEL